jgi:sugar phosphate permease
MEMDRTRSSPASGNPLIYRWLMFGIAGTVYFLACLHRISPSVIARDLELAFSIDATVLGFIAASYFYSYSAVQPVVGALSDTMGPRRVIAIFTGIAFAGSLIFGMADNPIMAIVGRTLVGAGVGGIFIPTVKIISRWYRSNEFASITGIMLAIGGFGALSASLPLTYLVLLLGWRISFVVLGVFSLVLALLSWIVVRDCPEDKGWPPIEGGILSQEGASDPPENIGVLKRFGIIFKEPGFWLVTISIFFAGGAGLAFQGLWAVPYLVDVYGFSRVEAGGLFMLIPLGFALGAPALGFLTDKLGFSKMRVLLTALAIGLGCWLIVLLFGSKPPASFIAPLFFIMGICGGGSLPLYFALIKDLFPPSIMGTAVGLMNPSAFFATALYQPFTGYLLDRVGRLSSGGYPIEGYQHVFMAFMVSFVIAFFTICLLLVPKFNRS